MFVLLITVATHCEGGRVSTQKILGIGVGLAGVLVVMGAEALRGVGTAAPLAQSAVLAASLYLRAGADVGAALCPISSDSHGSGLDELRSLADAASFVGDRS